MNLDSKNHTINTALLFTMINEAFATGKIPSSFFEVVKLEETTEMSHYAILNTAQVFDAAVCMFIYQQRCKKFVEHRQYGPEDILINITTLFQQYSFNSLKNAHVFIQKLTEQLQKQATELRECVNTYSGGYNVTNKAPGIRRGFFLWGRTIDKRVKSITIQIQTKKNNYGIT